MPVSVRVGLTVILLVLALALAVTVIRARAGKLRRNGIAGVRTPSALVDDRAFARANQAAMPFQIAGAAVAAVLALVVAITGLRGISGVAGSGLLIIVGIVVGALLLFGGLRGERAARDGAGTPPPAGKRGGPARRQGHGNGGGRSVRPRGSNARSGTSRPKVSGRGGEPRRPSR